MIRSRLRWTRIGCTAMLALLLGGCAGAIIGTATDTAIAVAKVPFKVGGAVADVVTDDD